MLRTKFITTLTVSILCLGLLLTAPLFRSDAALREPFALFDASELIEAPADATVYVSLDGLGSVLLASGAKVRLTALNNSTLAASVIRGELVVNLQPHSRAIIKAGESIFSTARGALFHAGMREGSAFMNTSDDLRDRLPDLGSWSINAPRLRPELGNWPIQVPKLAPEASLKLVSRPSPPRLSFVASHQPIGRVESLGLVKINQTSAARGGILWGSELIQAPEGSSARATLDGVAQVLLTGGSRARLLTPTMGRTGEGRILAASLVSGSLVVQLAPSTAGCVEAAGATFLAGRGARIRVMLVEGRAVFETIEGVGFEKGEWTLTAPESLYGLMASIAQQQPQLPGAPAAARRYIVRPVGLSSNLVVRARTVRQIQVRVTDEDDRPVKGVPIIFTLGSPSSGASLGTLSAAGAAIFTNDNGIASVEFSAADVPTSGSITATVQGTTYSWVGQINLIKVVPGFWAPQNAVPVLATAAAAATIGTIKAATKEDLLPVKPVGETIIKP